METHLTFIGILLVILAIIHVFFPSYFKWEIELKSLSLINRQMMTVHTFFIALAVLQMGVLCLIAATELTQTHLGKTICLGFGLFWGIRLLFQLFIYSKELWKGKAFETVIHILFTILWAYLTLVFLSIFLGTTS